MARKPLDKWILEAATDSDKEKITALTLVHMQGMQHIEIHTYKYPPTGGVDPQSLANMFRGKAEAYCQDLPGVQTFNLWAFYGKQEPEARQPFMVNVSADHMQGGLSTEPPTDQGLTMQKMRQNEAMFQQVYRRQQIMDDFGLRMIEMQGKMIDRLMHENMDHFNMAKDMLLSQQLNDHTRKMEMLAYQRSTEERKKWLQFAPALVNTLLGKDIFPQSMEDTALIEGIAENVTEEQVAMLGGLGLPDVLLGPLAARVAKAMEKKRKASEALAALPAYRGKPEDDITGGGGLQ